MICYKCGNPLGSGHLCLRCGADVTIYRKIVRISNTYYNKGLDRARMRDLTGAIDCLGKSLQFDKKNTQARNLLGLCYYEMGEVVEALCQWVVSKNLQPQNNPAERYLQEVQRDKGKLERMNQAIKKFNQALEYATHDCEDLAVIQLRTVVSQFPQMMKAHELLALLYIKEGEYAKANKLLKRVLQVDRGNTLCLKYSHAIRGKLSKPKKQQQQAAYVEQQVSRQSANDVIVPKRKERPRVVQYTIGMFLGMAIFFCTYFFLILPSLQSRQSESANQTMIYYNEKLEAKDNEITELNASITALEEEKAAVQAELDAYTAEDGTLTNYDLLLTAMYQYTQEDWMNLALTFAEINSEAVSAEAYTSCYAFLEEYVTGEEMFTTIFESGVEAYEDRDYETALTYFSVCLQLNADDEASIYYMAMTYEAMGDEANSLIYFQDLYDRFPDGTYYDEAAERVETDEETEEEAEEE